MVGLTSPGFAQEFLSICSKRFPDISRRDISKCFAKTLGVPGVF